PDGKGALLLTGKEKKGGVVFMDWQGNEQKIDISAIAALKSKDDKGATSPEAALMLGPLVLPSWWDGNLAVVGLKRGKLTYQIDTVKKTAVVSDAFKAFAEKEKDPKNEMPLSLDFAGDVSVTVKQLSEGEKEKLVKYSRVAVLNHQTKMEKVLLAKA